MCQMLEESRQNGKTADDYSNCDFYQCPDSDVENGECRIFGAGESDCVQEADDRCYACEQANSKDCTDTKFFSAGQLQFPDYEEGEDED